MRRSITVFPELSDKEVSAIAETRKLYARAFNMSAECLISNSSTSRRFLHEVQYERIKEECPSLPTGLIQCARDVAVEAVKAWNAKKAKLKQKKPKKAENYITRVGQSGQAAVNQPLGWGAIGEPATEPVEKTLTSKPSGLPEGR